MIKLFLLIVLASFVQCFKPEQPYYLNCMKINNRPMMTPLAEENFKFDENLHL
jgi:hypothetical protein